MLDPSIVDYFQKRRLEVEALLKTIDSFHRMSAQKLKALTNAIASHPDTQSLVSGLSSGYPELYDILYYQAAVTDAVTVRVNINLSPAGWRFNLLNQKGDQLSDRAALQDWLTMHGIPWFVRQGQPWRLGYHDAPLPYDGGLGLIQDVAVGLLRHLRRVRANPIDIP